MTHRLLSIHQIVDGCNVVALGRLLDDLRADHGRMLLAGADARALLEHRRVLTRAYKQAGAVAGLKWLRCRAQRDYCAADEILHAVYHRDCLHDHPLAERVCWHVYLARANKLRRGDWTHMLFALDYKLLYTAFTALYLRAVHTVKVLRRATSSPLHRSAVSRETFCQAILARACIHCSTDADIELGLSLETLLDAYDAGMHRDNHMKLRVPFRQALQWCCT